MKLKGQGCHSRNGKNKPKYSWKWESRNRHSVHGQMVYKGPDNILFVRAMRSGLLGRASTKHYSVSHEYQ